MYFSCVGDDEMAGYAARMVEKMKAYSILVGKPEGKRLLGRPKHR
jgi:hypothetical protein